MNSEADWAKAAEQFQQSFTEGWTKAVQSFQTMDTGAAGAAAIANPISLSPERLKEVQQDYMREAADLWNESLKGKPSPKDRRFGPGLHTHA